MQRKLKFSGKSSEQDEDEEMIFELMKNELNSIRASKSKLYDFNFEDDKASENPKRFFWEKGFIQESQNNSDLGGNSSCN